MLDKSLSELDRLARADRLDLAALLRWQAALVRREGEAANLELLRDHRVWDRCPEELQDRALRAAAERLGAAFEFRGAERYACAGLEQRIGAFIHKKSGALLHLLPGGPSIQGDPPEVPVRRGFMEAPFLIGRHAVSQRVWDAIGGEDARHRRGPELPIEGVSWREAQAWLRKAGDGLRLPDEAEWEYAARAGSNTRTCFGVDFSEEEVNSQGIDFDPSRCVLVFTSTAPVGSMPANAFGLFEVHGNVEEWCQDSKGGVERALRGGSHGSFRDEIRSGRSGSERFDEGNLDIGFRIAKSLP